MLDYHIGKLYIEAETTAWVETYPMNTIADVSVARTNLQTIATKRSRILARGHKIVRASVSRKAAARFTLPVGGYSTSPVLLGAEMTDPEYANTSGVGLLFRFDTGDGKVSRRLLRGVRDTWITRNRNSIGAPTVYGVGGPYLTYSAPDTALNLIGDYLASVRDLTVMIKATGGSPASYVPYTFEEWSYIRVAKHDEGKRIKISSGRQRTMA